MTREQHFFLGILADYLWKRKTIPQEDIDWRKIADYAKIHQVEGIVWYQCKDYLQSRSELIDLEKQLNQASAATIFCYANNRQAYNELKEEFQKRNVRFFFIKGMDVAALYPKPAYRTMGDLDIVMPLKEDEKIHTILLELGFKKRKGVLVKTYERETTYLEIHNQLVNPENLETYLRRKYFNNYWNYVSVKNKTYEIDKNFHFLFLIEHTKQHFSASGAGFRQFMDIAVTVMNQKDLDWDWIERELRKIDLWVFAASAFAFINKWWGIKSPITIKELDEKFYQESTEFIFKNGVFGQENENAGIHFVEKQIRVSALPRFFRKISVAIRKVCISYNVAVMLPYLSFIKRKKLLLPFAWLYRVFYVALNKKGNISKIIKLLFGSNEVLDYHKKLMDEWGV